MKEFEPVIGLEVHVHLKTKTKAFCSCPTVFGDEPNSNICPVCAGYPGVLPVLNEEAVRLVVKAALGLHCRINRTSVMARKQYYYPDLPKNYQISQYELPLAEDGWVTIFSGGGERKIRIHRLHLEEDAGKLLHAIGSQELDYSLLDLNRAGIPLMEIVSEPDIHSPEEAVAYLKELKNILEYLEISDCNMEEGKFRCDANISLRPVGEEKLGTKTEVKNMNSFTAIRQALTFEIERQQKILTDGGTIIQETRLYNSEAGTTESMRTKEEASDYRYFPEPDLLPIELSQEYIEKIRESIGDLPADRRKKFLSEYGLSEYDTNVLVDNRILSDYYLAVLGTSQARRLAKLAANWLLTEIVGRIKDDYQKLPKPENFLELLELIAENVISGKIAKEVLDEMLASGRGPKEIVRQRGLEQISNESELERMCAEALKENEKAVREYQQGKERALGAIVGAVMKKSRGRANPRLVNEILNRLLQSGKK